MNPIAEQDVTQDPADIAEMSLEEPLREARRQLRLLRRARVESFSLLADEKLASQALREEIDTLKGLDDELTHLKHEVVRLEAELGEARSQVAELETLRREAAREAKVSDERATTLAEALDEARSVLTSTHNQAQDMRAEIETLHGQRGLSARLKGRIRSSRQNRKNA